MNNLEFLMLALLLFALEVLADALKQVLSRRLQGWFEQAVQAWSSPVASPATLVCENRSYLLSPAQRRLAELNHRIQSHSQE
jgi:hypothetical protein